MEVGGFMAPAKPALPPPWWRQEVEQLRRQNRSEEQSTSCGLSVANPRQR